MYTKLRAVYDACVCNNDVLGDRRGRYSSPVIYLYVTYDLTRVYTRGYFVFFSYVFFFFYYYSDAVHLPPHHVYHALYVYSVCTGRVRILRFTHYGRPTKSRRPTAAMTTTVEIGRDIRTRTSVTFTVKVIHRYLYIVAATRRIASYVYVYIYIYYDCRYPRLGGSYSAVSYDARVVAVFCNYSRPPLPFTVRAFVHANRRLVPCKTTVRFPF